MVRPEHADPESPNVAVSEPLPLARALFGPTGEMLISTAVFLSAAGFVNATILQMPRIYYAMAEDGVLTTIDIEPEHQRSAKEAFSDASIGPSRTRLISGRAQEVLTRLADDSYDLVFIDADPLDQPDYVVEGVRLLRSGGVIVVHGAAAGGRAGDPSARDAEVAAVREAARLIAENELLTPALVPLGDGLLAAVRD